MSPQRKRPRRSADDDATDDDEVTFRVDPPAKKARLAPSPRRVPSPPPPPPTPLCEPRRSPNGFILPDPLPEGYGLVDNVGNRWTIGKSIGLGGFGEIYAARRCDESGEDFVVKVEPHTNGPLFTEIAFYLKSGKSSQIDQWKSEKNVGHLGIAHFVASGSLMFNGKKFRFLVLPRYGTDVQSIVDASAGRFFSLKTACSMALQVIDTLEFIHSHGYIHKDIKGSNLLVGRDDAKKIFLVDFGLCSRFIQNDLHKPYRPDRRWAHEGTMEYTSRDSHLGCFSRRGDLEVLLYNLVEWLGGKLPWEDMQEEKPTVIHEHKIKAFEDVDAFLSSCFPGAIAFPAVLKSVMNLVSDLRFEEKPCYDSLRSLLAKEVEDSSAVFDEVVLNVELGSRNSSSRRAMMVDGEKENADPMLLERSMQKGRKKKKARRTLAKKHVSLDTYERLRQDTIRRLSEQSLRNPTPAMIEQMERMKTRSQSSAKKLKKWRNLTPSSMTPAMEAIVEMKRSRIHATEVNSDDSISNHFPKSKRSRRRTLLQQESQKVLRKSTSLLPPETSPTEPKKKRVITRSRTVPILPPSTSSFSASAATKGTSSSFRDHVNHVVGAGLDLIHGISRSLFPSSFKKN